MPREGFSELNSRDQKKPGTNWCRATLNLLSLIFEGLTFKNLFNSNSSRFAFLRYRKANG